MTILNFKVRKIKSDFPRGKLLDFFLDGIWVSAPRKDTEVLQKNQIEKNRFQVQKYEKYLKSKTDLRRPLGAFINELWAIYVFLKSGQI